MRHSLASAVRRGLVRPEGGATAVEYAFIVALIAALVIFGVTLIGVATSNNFGTVTL